MPFRHGHISGYCLSKEESQLPFGSVPFRHAALSASVILRIVTRCLNYLSAQCPFGTRGGGNSASRRHARVSITFRLSALSALARTSSSRVMVTLLMSQLPFGSVPFRHLADKANEVDAKGLNYLSAQCPFGTVGHHVRHYGSPVGVSITFRLSALSAQDEEWHLD